MKSVRKSTRKKRSRERKNKIDMNGQEVDNIKEKIVLNLALCKRRRNTNKENIGIGLRAIDYLN